MIYIYNLALDNSQGLICYKTLVNQTKNIYQQTICLKIMYTRFGIK